jgi:hypothetical protein
MPWWSWVLIWAVLVLALVGMLVRFGFVLFRKAMAALDALGDLGDQVADLEAQADILAGDADSPRTPPAIFADRAALAAGVSASRSERAHRRQLRRDQRITQGKLLNSTALTQRTGPHA